MERQLLCFLAPSDERAFLEAIDGVDPGIVVLPGRLVSTDDAASLLADPSRHRFAQGIRSLRRLYLAHKEHTRLLRFHPQPEGPWKGWYALDPLHSEVFELTLPEVARGRLAPARLAATVLAYEGHERIRKGPAFGKWVGRVLRHLGRMYPKSAIDFIHVAEGARAFSEGGGRLTYLEETVLPEPRGPAGQKQKERIP